MRSTCFALGCLLLGFSCGAAAHAEELIVGSKTFPESNIVAEIVTQLARHEQLAVKHRAGVGPTTVLWKALLAGEVDVYPEYTGTIAKEILQDDRLRDDAAIRAALARQGVVMSQPLGFTNPYAIGMQEERAAELGITKISQLREHPDLSFAFSTEFLQRSDGWPSLQRVYELPQTKVKLMEHGLAYRAVAGKEVDATDVYLTDASVRRYRFRVLEDDLAHFPPYAGVLLYRQDLSQRVPAFPLLVERLEGAISTDDIQQLNEAVQVDRKSAANAAAGFLDRQWQIVSDVNEDRLARRIWKYTLEHLFLVVTSLTAGILVAVPLGVLAAKRRHLEHVILSTAEIIQTIPGLALLVLLMPPVRFVGLQGTGPAPVIVALFLYSLLPIIRNTFTGMRDIPHSLRESAQVLGLTPFAALWQIELPLASRMILAGIKTTAVMTVGYATLGGLIGAGGYGQIISAGLSQDDMRLMMEGAIPAAILAIVVKSLFEIGERFVVPRGLRVQAQG